MSASLFFICVVISPDYRDMPQATIRFRDKVRAMLWRHRHRKQDTEPGELPEHSHGRDSKPGRADSGPRIHDSEKEHFENASR